MFADVWRIAGFVDCGTHSRWNRWRKDVVSASWVNWNEISLARYILYVFKLHGTVSCHCFLTFAFEYCLQKYCLSIYGSATSVCAEQGEYNLSQTITFIKQRKWCNFKTTGSLHIFRCLLGIGYGKAGGANGSPEMFVLIKILLFILLDVALVADYWKTTTLTSSGKSEQMLSRATRQRKHHQPQGFPTGGGPRTLWGALKTLQGWQ